MFEPGQIIANRYEIKEEVGAGGMGTVYRARQLDLGRDVAIKIPIPEALKNPAYVARFAREAKTCARLVHENIVQVHEFKQDESDCFLVMEFVEGTDLKKLTREAPAELRVRDVANILKAALEGLGYAHENGIIHRDIKPHNIMVTRHTNGRWRTKIMDFGIVHLDQQSDFTPMGEELTFTGQTLGTPSYMSPEQIRGEGVCTQSDIYSFGCVIYYLFTKKTPFTGTGFTVGAAHLSEEPPALRESIPDLPNEIDSLVKRCLAKDPKDRPQSAEQLSNELELALSPIYDKPMVDIWPVSEERIITDPSGPSASEIQLTESEAPELEAPVTKTDSPHGDAETRILGGSEDKIPSPEEGAAPPKPPPASKAKSAARTARQSEEPAPSVAKKDELRMHMADCKHCGQPNELPYLFCEECGQPRFNIGKLTIFFNLWITGMGFFLMFYFQEIMPWAWPIYIVYSLFFFQYTLALPRGRTRETARLAGWMLVFLGGFGVLYHVSQSYGSLFFILSLRDLPEEANRDPWVFYPVALAVLTVVGLPLYFRWRRIFGEVSAYRIVILSALAVGLGAISVLTLLQFMHQRIPMPGMEPELTRFLEEKQPEFINLLGLFAMTMIRVFLFEIFVFAAVRGYARAKNLPKQSMPAELSNESALVRSSYVFTRSLRRFLYALETMAGYLISTLVELSRDLSRVITAFFRELFFPITALIIAGTLLAWAAEQTVQYNIENSVGALASIAMAALGLMAVEVVFLGCKTTYRWDRIVNFHGQLISWILPNLLVFFLLMSVSLAGTSWLLNERLEDFQLPFKIGVLTQSVGVFLALLVMIILIRKRSLLWSETADETMKQARAREELLEREEAFDEALEEDEIPQVMAEKIASQNPEQDEEEQSGPEPDPFLNPPRQERERKRWKFKEEPKAKQSVKEKLANAAGQWRKHADGAVERLTKQLSGPPENVRKLMELKDNRFAKDRQLQALAHSRETISDETYEQLHAQYSKELVEFETKIQTLSVEVEADHIKLTSEIEETQEILETKKARAGELNALHESGALEDKDYEKQIRSVKAEIEALEEREKFLVRKEEYFKKALSRDWEPAR